MADENEEFLEDMKDTFSIFDKKGDMKVEDNQIINVLRSLGLNPLTADVNKIIVESDLKGKRVDFETFYGIYKQMSGKPSVGTYEDMVEGLKTFDREQTGHISGAELRHILSNIGDRMTEKQCDDIISHQEDQNGLVNFEHLIKFVMNA